MTIKNLRFILVACFLFPLLGTDYLASAQAQTDVLRLNVFFERNHTGIDPSFRGNAENMQRFREVLQERLDEGCVVDAVLLRGSASPEGPSVDNKMLSVERSHALDKWFSDTLGLGSVLFHREAVGEDWEGLARIIRTLDVPWRAQALDIIEHTPIWVTEGGRVVDSRKNRLRRLEGGAPWRWLDTNVFPELRAVGMSVECILSRPVAPAADTIYITRTVRDTVFIDITPAPSFEAPLPAEDYFAGRRLLFALRTNVLAIPLANAGVEVPLSRRVSVGADIYYPWMWRPGHKDGIDKDGVCNELMAADVELRYWFPRKDLQPGRRLLGHSIGLYGLGGYFDFERDWSGRQGEFVGFGLDYLWAAPILGGRMHVELELGVGCIWALSRPYDCLVPGGVIYHRPGIQEKTFWAGPTRAQVSLVIPVYSRKKGGAR